MCRRKWPQVGAAGGGSGRRWVWPRTNVHVKHGNISDVHVAVWRQMHLDINLEQPGMETHSHNTQRHTDMPTAASFRLGDGHSPDPSPVHSPLPLLARPASPHPPYTPSPTGPASQVLCRDLSPGSSVVPAAHDHRRAHTASMHPDWDASLPFWHHGGLEAAPTNAGARNPAPRP